MPSKSTESCKTSSFLPGICLEGFFIFGKEINGEFAMQVVGVGFIIGVLQDSSETALNSSTDVLFTAAADIARCKRQEQLQLQMQEEL